MAYISKYSGEEIDNLLDNSSSVNNIIDELALDVSQLSTDLSSTNTKISNLESVDSGLDSRLSTAESKLNATVTASRALVSDSSGKVTASSVTSTQLGYLSGVTSAIQTQLNAKAPSYTYSTTDLTAGSSSLTTGKLYLVYE